MAGQRRQVEIAELAPLRHQHQRVGIARQFLRGVAVANLQIGTLLAAGGMAIGS